MGNNGTLEVQDIGKLAGKKSSALSRAAYRAYEVYQRMEQGIYTLPEPQESSSSMIEIPEVPTKHERVVLPMQYNGVNV